MCTCRSEVKKKKKRKNDVLDNLYYNVQCVSVCPLSFMKLKITKDQRGVRIEFSRTYQCHRNTGFP